MKLNDEQEEILRELAKVHPMEVWVRQFFRTNHPTDEFVANLAILDQEGLIRLTWNNDQEEEPFGPMNVVITSMGLDYLEAPPAEMPPGTRRLRLIENELLRLKRMTLSDNNAFLAYLIETAHHEARSILGGQGVELSQSIVDLPEGVARLKPR